MVVNTRNWWPGKKVVVSPEWIAGVSWLKAAPDYDASRPSERAYESRLFEHHRRRKYWEWEDR